MLTESSGKRPHRHAIELASRRWREPNSGSPELGSPESLCDFELTVGQAGGFEAPYDANDTPVFMRSKKDDALDSASPVELWLRCDVFPLDVDWERVNHVKLRDCDWWYSTKLSDSNENNMWADNIMAQNLSDRTFKIKKIHRSDKTRSE